MAIAFVIPMGGPGDSAVRRPTARFHAVEMKTISW